MRRRYHILDVFTDTKLAGNPLAVVLDADGLDTAVMQAIACEFNLSETVFCVAPRDPVNTAALRIFTPAVELPFAGHPTIGTAVLLAKLNAPELLAAQDVGLVLEQQIGLVSCSARHRRGEAPHARFDVPQLPQTDGETRDAATIADLLRIDIDSIGFDTHRPIGCSAGVPFVFVPIASVEALGRARLRPADTRTAYYLYTPSADAMPRAFRSRMLATGLGVSEDPATGSAAAAFAGVLLAMEGLADGEHDCVLHQGVEMGRPSRLGLAFSVEDGRIAGVTIGGSAVLVAEGTLDL